MSLQTYGYSAQSKRFELIRVSELLVFVALVLVVCWLVFPRHLSDSLRGGKLDAVSKQYIETWLQAKPDDVQLRMLLAQALIRLGALKEAHEHLQVIEHSSDKTIAEQGYWLHAQLEFERLMAVQPEQRKSHVLWSISQQSLSKVDYQALPGEHIEQFVRMALLLGFSKEANEASQYWLNNTGSATIETVNIAEVFIAYQEYTTAANLYIQALTKAPSLEQQASYFVAALLSYQAGSKFDEGLLLIERFGNLFLDIDQVLYQIVLFARAANKPEVASFYAGYLMGFGGGP